MPVIMQCLEHDPLRPPPPPITAEPVPSLAGFQNQNHDGPLHKVGIIVWMWGYEVLLLLQLPLLTFRVRCVREEDPTCYVGDAAFDGEHKGWDRAEARVVEPKAAVGD